MIIFDIPEQDVFTLIEEGLATFYFVDSENVTLYVPRDSHVLRAIHRREDADIPQDADVDTSNALHRQYTMWRDTNLSGAKRVLKVTIPVPKVNVSVEDPDE